MYSLNPQGWYQLWFRGQIPLVYLANTVSKTVEHIRTEMNHVASKLPEYPVIMAMYGVGASLGPQLMAEIGDISRFQP